MSVDREYRIKILTVTEGDAGVAAEGLKNTGKAAEQAGENLHFMDLKGREAHEAFNKINQIAPGLGSALRAAFNPELIGVTGFLVGIEAIKSGIEGYEKKIEEASEAAAKTDFSAGFEAARDVIREDTDSADEYLRKLHEILQGEQGITAELANRLQIIAAIKAATQEQAEAEKTVAIAKIQQDEATGKITQTQSIQQKAAVEKAYLERKAREEESAFTAEQKARTDALNEASAKQGMLDKAVADQQAKLDAANVAKSRAKDAPTLEALTKAQQEASDARDLVQDLTSGLHPLTQQSETLKHGSLEGAVAAARQDAENKQNRLGSLETLFRQAAAANAVDTTALENELKARQAAAQKNAEAVSKARDEVNKAADERDATAGARRGTLTSQESSVDIQAHTEMVRRAQQLQQEFERQGPAMDRNDMRELLSLITQLGESFNMKFNALFTKAEWNQEKQALLRLIEAKGK